ncbi:MAG: transposase [Treponema sp.]|nr:transposase [Treponema sp.]
MAEKIILVMDNANQRFENTHNIASLYETYPAEEAKRIKDRLELHYTPKHGSWLNMAEIELSVINNQGLPARVGTQEEMGQRVRVWNEAGNGKGCKITWRFRTADVRIKLKCLYPQFNS